MKCFRANMVISHHLHNQLLITNINGKNEVKKEN